MAQKQCEKQISCENAAGKEWYISTSTGKITLLPLGGGYLRGYLRVAVREVQWYSRCPGTIFEHVEQRPLVLLSEVIAYVFVVLLERYGDNRLIMFAKIKPSKLE